MFSELINKNEVIKQKLKIPFSSDNKLTLLEYLKNIELILDYLNSRYKYLKQIKPIDVKKKSDSLVERRKTKNTEYLKNKQLKDAEENKIKLFEKYEKVYPMQKRKVMVKSRPILQQAKVKTKNKNDDEPKIEELLGIDVVNNKDGSYPVVNTIS